LHQFRQRRTVAQQRSIGIEIHDESRTGACNQTKRYEDVECCIERRPCGEDWHDTSVIRRGSATNVCVGERWFKGSVATMLLTDVLVMVDAMGVDTIAI
jgi:hypothetical protein